VILAKPLAGAAKVAAALDLMLVRRR